MNINMKKKIEEIRNEIRNSENPIVLFDTDTDGLTSFLQLKKVFKKIKGFPLEKELRKQKKLVREKISKKNDLIIILDIPVLTEDFLKLISENKIIWVDHHPSNDEILIKKYNIINLNPLNYDFKDNRATSYISFLISNKFEGNLPLVAIGTVSDFFLLNVLVDFYEKDRKKFNLIFSGLENSKRIEIFNFIEKYKFNDIRVRKRRENYIRYLTYETEIHNLKLFFDFICSQKEQEDIYRSVKIIESLTIEDIVGEIAAGKTFPFKEYNSMIVEYKKKLDLVKNLEQGKFFFYEYSGKFSFAKTLAEELSYLFKNSKIILICFRKIGKNWYNCSMRGKGVKINKIVEDSLRGLDGKGGGHPFAAGMSVNKKDYEEFKKKMFEKLKNI